MLENLAPTNRHAVKTESDVLEVFGKIDLKSIFHSFSHDTSVSSPIAFPGSCQDSSCHGASAEASAALRAFSASDLALLTAAYAAAFSFSAIASFCLTFALSQQSIAVFRAKWTKDTLFSNLVPPICTDSALAQ